MLQSDQFGYFFEQRQRQFVLLVDLLQHVEFLFKFGRLRVPLREYRTQRPSEEGEREHSQQHEHTTEYLLWEVLCGNISIPDGGDGRDDKVKA